MRLFIVAIANVSRDSWLRVGEWDKPFDVKLLEIWGAADPCHSWLGFVASLLSFVGLVLPLTSRYKYNLQVRFSLAAAGRDFHSVSLRRPPYSLLSLSTPVQLSILRGQFYSSDSSRLPAATK